MNVQLVIVATAVVLTIVLMGLVFLLSELARRNRSSAIRVSAATALVVVLLLSPGVFDAVVTRVNPTSGVASISIDPGWMIKIAPALIAAMFATLLIVRGRTRAPSARLQDDAKR